MLNARPLVLANLVCLLTLGGICLARRGPVAAVPSGLLAELPLQFRDWKPEEISIPQSELALLQPEAVLVRRFHAADNGWAELAVIAGRQKRTVHTPAFCMAGGGWETLSKRDCAVPGASSAYPAVRTVVARDGRCLMVTYFFTDGEQSTRSLPQFQWSQMVKKLQGKQRLGALVRIVVPVTKSGASAAALSDEFAQATLPQTTTALRSMGQRVAAR